MREITFWEYKSVKSVWIGWTLHNFITQAPIREN